MQEAALCRNIKILRLCTTETTPRAVDFWGFVSSFMGQCSVEMDIHVEHYCTPYSRKLFDFIH